jgi:hypothetical protein
MGSQMLQCERRTSAVRGTSRGRFIAVAFLLGIAGGTVTTHVLAARHARVLGLKRVIAFTYSPGKDFDVKQLHSPTFVGPANPGDWKYWRPRHVVSAPSKVWHDLLPLPVDKAVENLTQADYGGNPHPVTMIDEFGFDYGGLMDQKSAQILRQAKQRKPELALTVWEMRGPVPQVLAEAYRDVADLVMFESYMGSRERYFLMAWQAWSARRYGILQKSILVLGVGKGGNPGEEWAQTKEELEQQMRFVRLIAPESPGVGFYSGTPELLRAADALCARFFKFPTDGSGLPSEVRELANTFSRHYARPTIAVSPSFVEPNYQDDGKGIVEPRMLRVYMLNLGDQDARNVKVRVLNPPNQGAAVIAKGEVPLIPPRGSTVGVLPVVGQARVWVGDWIVEVDAPGCDVLTFKG